MLLDLPGADRHGSTNICALALAKFIEQRNQWNCEDMKPLPAPAEFRCPRPTHPVRFDVQELNEDQTDAPPMVGSLTGDLGEAVATLRSVPIFRPLPAVVLGRLASEIRVERYEPGRIVVDRGSIGRAFYVVYEGVLEVVGYADQEMSSVVTKLKPRDCFGEMSLLTGAPCAATVVASTAVTLLAVSREHFERLLRENSYMASCFTRLLASRLLSMNNLLVKEGSKPFSGKLQEMSLATVLQVLADSNRSGTLMIDDYEGNHGQVAFSAGRIFEASVHDLTGERAIFQMLTWNRGDFWLDKRAVPRADTVDCSVMGLLLEGMRRLDEAAGHD